MKNIIITIVFIAVIILCILLAVLNSENENTCRGFSIGAAVAIGGIIIKLIIRAVNKSKKR